MSVCVAAFLLVPTGKSLLELRPSRPREGRWPSSRTLGGMRWTRQVRKTNDSCRVRQSHAVLSPRCWRQAGDDAFRIVAGDGDNKAGLRGEHGISRQPSRGESRVIRRYLWWTNSCAFFICTRGYGCLPRTRLSLRPHPTRGMIRSRLGHIRAARALLAAACPLCDNANCQPPFRLRAPSYMSDLPTERAGSLAN